MPRRRSVDRIFLHCSATDASGPRFEGAALAATIDEWHARRWRRRNGYAIGYHYVIDKRGVISTGRPVSMIPAAQRGHNTGSVAICLHGLRKGLFTREQFSSLRDLVLQLYRDAASHRRRRPLPTVHGHCEVAAKACPVFAYKAVLELDRYGYPDYVMRALRHTPPLAHVPVKAMAQTAASLETVLPMLRYGSRGSAVAKVQRVLNIPDDGLFFNQTRRAVKKFQKAHGLKPDGIVGPLTWKALLAYRR